MAGETNAKKELAKFIEQLSEEDAVRILAFAKSLPKKSDQKHSQKTRRQKSAQERLASLRDVVRQNPEKWNVDSMAEAYGLTRSRFSVLYKKTFGASPDKEKREFLNQKARDLLSSTDKSVQKIAAECGYNECENFIRAFRNCNGMSPLQFRKNAD
ncbi:MAG: helix-turn-helix transcriptional regulator [Treponema sp.]|nr:helix-turn-helix transcriptional regulator [Treponema sp.]